MVNNTHALNDQLFFTASPEELSRGYRHDKHSETYTCLICYSNFEKGCIYTISEKNYDAEKAIKEHIALEHGSIGKWLVNLDKRLTGLTSTQKLLIECQMEGLDDKETAARMSISPSTVRNHRFQMKERDRQARVFLALNHLVSVAEPIKTKNEEFMDVKRSAVMVDERYAITQSEYEDIIKKYFPNGPDGILASFPVKEKRKLAILTNLAHRFVPGVRYTEKELTEILKTANVDHATLRRYLIEYGFMDRERNCSAYWLKE